MTVTYIKILGMSSKSCDNLPGIQPCLAPLVEQRFCHLMNFCQAIQQFGQVRRVLCVSLLLKQPKAFRCQQRFCKRDLRVNVLALWTGVKRQGRINWNTLVLQQEDDRHQQGHQQNNTRTSSRGRAEGRRFASSYSSVSSSSSPSTSFKSISSTSLGAEAKKCTNVGPSKTGAFLHCSLEPGTVTSISRNLFASFRRLAYAPISMMYAAKVPG